jgi:HK97 family phage major capsid protein
MNKTKRMCAYVCEKPHGNAQKGDVLHYDEEDGDKLKEMGLVRDAESADLGKDDDDDEETDEIPDGEKPEMVARAFQNQIEESLAKATQLAVQKANVPAKRRPPVATVPAEVIEKKWVFDRPGELIQTYWKAVSKGDPTARNKIEAYKERLRKSPLGQAEGTGSLGGLLIVPEWDKEIFNKVYELPKLYDMIEGSMTSTPTLNVEAINETSRANGSRWGGVQSYYVAEGGQITSSTTNFAQVQLQKQTMLSLVYFTQQLLEDAYYPAQEELEKLMGLDITFMRNDAIINGAASGAIPGLLNEASTVTVSTSTPARNIYFGDIAKMYAALWTTCKAGAVWLGNQNVTPVLQQMAFDASASSKVPAWGLTYNAHEEFPLRIFGKPYIEVENCPTIGAAGDLILVDLRQVRGIHSPIEFALSTDFKFDTYQVAVRAASRHCMKSRWTSALTPYSGTQAFGHTVILATRGT